MGVNEKLEESLAASKLTKCLSLFAYMLHVCSYKKVPGLIWMCDPDRVIWDVDHAGVFYFVDGMATNVGHLSALGNQDYVVALQETDKTCRKKHQQRKCHYSCRKNKNVYKDFKLYINSIQLFI